MNIELVRFAYTKYATLGLLRAGDLTLFTLEEPWNPDPDGPGGQKREPGKRESCVPDGTYVLEPHNTPKYRDVWALVNPALGVYHWSVPPGLKYGRCAVLIHNGNKLEETEGCILVGRFHTREDNQDKVLESRLGLDHLRAILRNETHQLTIRPTTGTLEIKNGK
jgi:hypothetical protein